MKIFQSACACPLASLDWGFLDNRLPWSAERSMYADPTPVHRVGRAFVELWNLSVTAVVQLRLLWVGRVLLLLSAASCTAGYKLRSNMLVS
jgi:hypothetical protein